MTLTDNERLRIADCVAFDDSPEGEKYISGVLAVVEKIVQEKLVATTAERDALRIENQAMKNELRTKLYQGQ